MLVNMQFAFFGYDDLHVETTVLERESVFGVIDAESAPHTFCRFVVETSCDVLLYFDRQAGRDAIAWRFDASLGG